MRGGGLIIPDVPHLATLLVPLHDTNLFQNLLWDNIEVLRD
jgi:hypothetical protein